MVDQAQQEKEEVEQEAEKARRQMELDVDEEIEQLKSRCASLVMALLNSSNLPCIRVLYILERQCSAHPSAHMSLCIAHDKQVV